MKEDHEVGKRIAHTESAVAALNSMGAGFLLGIAICAGRWIGWW